MTEEQAKSVADALGGDTWQSGGETWLVLLRRADGALVVLSDESVCEYKTEEAFEKGQPASTVLLC